MIHGSLFSGIGGFDLAARWVGWDNVFQVERDEWCCKVLARHFPETRRYADIRDFDGTEWRGAVDIISGGFPCQPFSHAGKRGGATDDRYLWPEMLRVIQEARPAWVIGENVAGLGSMAFPVRETFLADASNAYEEADMVLAAIRKDFQRIGYGVEIFGIPAAAVGAPHRRERVWIVAGRGNATERGSEHLADPNRNRLEGQRPNDGAQGRQDAGRPAGLRDRTDGGRSADWWEVEPNVGRVANGVPSRVDRLKGLGNAIVPQVAYEIFRAIVAAETNNPE